jgi:hypothetical protein
MSGRTSHWQLYLYLKKTEQEKKREPTIGSYMLQHNDALCDDEDSKKVTQPNGPALMYETLKSFMAE